MIAANRSVVDAVAEEVDAVVERDHNFVRGSDFSVIVCEFFHCLILLFHSEFLPCRSAEECIV